MVTLRATLTGHEGRAVCWKPLPVVERPAGPGGPKTRHQSVCHEVWSSYEELRQEAESKKTPVVGFGGGEPSTVFARVCESNPSLRIIGAVEAGLPANTSTRSVGAPPVPQKTTTRRAAQTLNPYYKTPECGFELPRRQGKTFWRHLLVAEAYGALRGRGHKAFWVRTAETLPETLQGTLIGGGWYVGCERDDNARALANLKTINIRTALEIYSFWLLVHAPS